MAEKFYQPGRRFFFAGEVQETREMDEAEESQVLNNIKEDIQYKDSIHLRQDFQKLERKYRESMKFSEMYVKFVFSNIVKDIYEEINPGDVKALSKMIDRLYRCRKIEDVLAITEQVVCELEKFVQEQNKGFRNEVMKVKQYIHHHYAEKSQCRESGKASLSLPGIFKCCIQGGDRSQSEPLCPGYPDEEIQGASGKYQYEDLTDRKRGWIFQ